MKLYATILFPKGNDAIGHLELFEFFQVFKNAR